MAHAIQASKLRWRLKDDSLKPLTLPETFYMATKGGGAFFGKVGSFEEGYDLDPVSYTHLYELSLFIREEEQDRDGYEMYRRYQETHYQRAYTLEEDVYKRQVQTATKNDAVIKLMKEEFKDIEVVRGGSVGIESISMMER